MARMRRYSRGGFRRRARGRRAYRALKFGRRRRKRGGFRGSTRFRRRRSRRYPFSIAVSRSVSTHAAVDGILKLNLHMNKDVLNVSKFDAFRFLYDVYKPLRLTVKYYIRGPANMLSKEDTIAIEHWSCYDPDGRGRVFRNIDNYREYGSVKYCLMKPFELKYLSLKPKWDYFPSVYNVVPEGRYANPWLDASAAKDEPSQNGLQLAFQGGAFSVVLEYTQTFMFKKRRNGQLYAPT